MVHAEYDIINFSPNINNINSYTREYNNLGNDSSMVILDNGHLCDTDIDDNTYLISNNITESIYLILSSIHIDDSKHRIYSRKM